MKTTAAVVIGDLSLVRALGRKRIPVVLATSEPRSSIALSRYCAEVVAIPNVVDAPDDAVDAIVAWARVQPARPVIFCQGDHDLLAFSRGRARVLPHAHLPLPKAELVENLVDKVRFAALARRLSLPVPVTTTLLVGTSLSEQLAAWCHFPCVLKPSYRSTWIGSALQVEGSGVASKAMRIESRAELERLAHLLAAHDTDLILQQAIDGGEDRIVSYHAYVRPSGELVAEFTGRKVRTSPRRYGFSTCVEITDEHDVKALGRDIVGKLDFSGVLKMDFKRDPRDESLYLLEINPRFNLWHHPATVAGASIPALVYADCVAPGSAQTPTTIRSGVRWMAGRDDLRAMREHRADGDLSLRAWLREVASVDVNEDFSWRDPLPGLEELRLVAQRKLRRLVTNAPTTTTTATTAAVKV
ncbi:MAG: ATP-grasp domain-containing protein [Deltaproteobacteria bacterium]|nr:ATP-grasp domain-containing protein [Deltaproteobacteria bacterium]